MKKGEGRTAEGFVIAKPAIGPICEQRGLKGKRRDARALQTLRDFGNADSSMFWIGDMNLASLS